MFYNEKVISAITKGEIIMEDLDKLMLMDDVMEDMEKIKRLEFGSDEWKKVQDSIDKRYNTTLAEIRMSVELD